MGISDMRLIDGKVSTTWCQRQIVRANTTFNAFLLPEVPDVAANRIHVDMIRYSTTLAILTSPHCPNQFRISVLHQM